MTKEQSEIAFFSTMGIVFVLLLALGAYVSWWVVAALAALGLFLVARLAALSYGSLEPPDDDWPA